MSSEDLVLDELAFAGEHVGPIRSGEKTATIRLPGEIDHDPLEQAAVEGGLIEFVTPKGEPFARAEIRELWRTDAKTVGESALGGHVNPDSTAAVEDLLWTYYPEREHNTASNPHVDVVTFDVVEQVGEWEQSVGMQALPDGWESSAARRPPTEFRSDGGEEDSAGLDCPCCDTTFYDHHDESATTSLQYHLKRVHPDVYEALQAAEALPDGGVEDAESDKKKTAVELLEMFLGACGNPQGDRIGHVDLRGLGARVTRIPANGTQAIGIEPVEELDGHYRLEIRGATSVEAVMTQDELDYLAGRFNAYRSDGGTQAMTDGGQPEAGDQGGQRQQRPGFVVETLERHRFETREAYGVVGDDEVYLRAEVPAGGQPTLTAIAGVVLDGGQILGGTSNQMAFEHVRGLASIYEQLVGHYELEPMAGTEGGEDA